MFGMLNADKLGVKCQLCMKRLQLVQQKRNRQIQTLKAEVAEMMKSENNVNARIRVEEVLRQEGLVRVYAILETYLILIQTRSGMLKQVKEPPQDMLHAINTIFFAADRVKYDLDEMPSIADALMSKFRSALCSLYGNKKYAEEIKEDHVAQKLGVDDVVIEGLKGFPAQNLRKFQKLKAIAQEFEVKTFDEEEMARELHIVNTTIVPKRSTAGSDSKSMHVNVMSNSTAGKAYERDTPNRGNPRPSQPNIAVVEQHHSRAQQRSTKDEYQVVGGAAFPPRVKFDDFGPSAYSEQQQQQAEAPRAQRPASMSPSPSIKDPWESLPPENTNLGLGFGDRLIEAMQAARRSTSEAASLSSGGGSRDVESYLHPEWSGDFMPSSTRKSLQLNLVELEEALPEVPCKEELPRMEDTRNINDDNTVSFSHTKPPTSSASGYLSDDDSLLVRLNRLRNN